MADLAFEPAHVLARKLRRREISAEALMRLYLDRVARFNPKLNAIVVLDADKAMDRAREADRELARGEVKGPLHGLPVTVKESFDVAGWKTTWGNPDWKDNVAAADSAVVERYKRAGAIIFGKTNVPRMLGDNQAYNEIYGRTCNPWNLERTPGGSSGGSSAALAAGLTGLEAGSDLGGSLRNPAHYCGIYAHKPSLNIVPGRGHAPPGVVGGNDTLAVVGPMARSAEDLDLALGLLAGADGALATAWKLDLPPAVADGFKDLRVAVWADDPRSPIDAAVGDRLQAAVEAIARAGATIGDTARPDADLAHAGYERLMSGGMESARDMSAWLEARSKLRLAWAKFFESWDVLICPIAPVTAFPHTTETDWRKRFVTVNGGRVPDGADLFWAGLATVSHLPSTAAPTGIARDGLPAGLQIIGAFGRDRTTIAAAKWLEKLVGGFIPPPGWT